MAVLVAPNKDEIMRHFGAFSDLQELMFSRGKDALADKSRVPTARLRRRR